MNTEEMIVAAKIMREAANTSHRASDRIEEAVRQLQIVFDAGYGGTAPKLLEELEKSNSTPTQPEPTYTLAQVKAWLEDEVVWLEDEVVAYRLLSRLECPNDGLAAHAARKEPRCP